jgi:hypothetical protein
MTGRSVCFGLFSLSYLRLECDVDYAYNAPSADSMRNRRGNCFEKNLIFLPTGVRCVTLRRLRDERSVYSNHEKPRFLLYIRDTDIRGCQIKTH